jgi:hypothetical protein
VASIVIRLDPAKLENPDADLRYEIPDRLAQRSAGLIQDDGYDYESSGDVMQIYLKTADLDSALLQVVAFLETEGLHGNQLARAAEVGVSESDASAATEFRLAYPPGKSGVILPPAALGS